ncbi:phosphoribosylglycinamide formyltransferase [Gaopeijia maritima]|uniref:Phosphoribosylglycinamide formyltransferase n=1 Tax=Gaopeijia maritima TaxID=3119007 RepID=A0ABU9E903_9BACT
MTSAAPRRLPAAVFASGGGSNFQALLDHGRDAAAPWSCALLVVDRPCGAEERAIAAGVPVRRVPVAGRPADEVAAETLAALEAAGIEMICLAGYLRLVPAPVVRRWSGRILNVHPALLPAFGGKGMWGRHVHAAVLESGARLSGPTVHLVDEAYDEGRILAQWPVAVQPDDTPEALAARVLEVEHRLYPRVADHLARAIAVGHRPEPMILSPGHFGPAEHAGP